MLHNIGSSKRLGQIAEIVFIKSLIPVSLQNWGLLSIFSYLL